MKLLNKILLFIILFALTVKAEEFNFFELSHQAQTALSHITHKDISQNHFQSCQNSCLSFQDPSSPLTFFIQINPSETSPLITFDDESSKTLILPHINYLKPSSIDFSESLLRQFLIGHSWHPYFGRSSVLRESQKTALQAFNQVLDQNQQSFLVISPTGTGKTSVLAQSLFIQMQRSDKKIFIVTAHQIQLVHQLFSHIQEEKEKRKLDKVHVINWSQPQVGGRTWQNLASQIKSSLESYDSLVLVITSQSLKARLRDFQTQDKRYGVYKELVEHLGGVYIDEAHHLGADQTQKAIEKLVEDSRAFLFGATATPIHHQVKLGRFFERQYWSYLNREDNLFETHGVERILEQLYLSINKGDITPFDELYVIGEDSFFEDIVEKENREELSSQDTTSALESTDPSPSKENKEELSSKAPAVNPLLTQEDDSQPSKVSFQEWKEGEKTPVFIQRSNSFYVLNPEYYESLNKMLAPLFEDNKKGFIVTGSIEEAENISEFLSQKRPDIEFEAYHSNVPLDERRQILQRSKESKNTHYIVAVDALNEGVDLPHLSAYIDLNANISIKEMIHRIGRVLRIYPGKLMADILFLINYRNEEMIGDVLRVLELADEISFKGGVRLRRERRRKEGVEVREGIESQRMSREDLQKERRRLKGLVKSFWNTRDDGSFLEPEELIKEINEYNKTAVQEKRIISNKSYAKNYRNISGAPSNPWKSYGREVWNEIRSQIHGWTGRIETTQRIVTKDPLEPEELVREINEYNKTAVQEKRIISIRSYVKNYKNISRAPSQPWRSYGREVWNEIRSQIHGWTGRIETTLEPEELVKEINEYNKTAVKEKRIISRTSYEKNYKNISGAPSSPWISYGREVWNEIRSQIHGWTGRIETTQRIVTKDPLEPEELVKEINEYNKTAVKEKRIISKKSYEKNYKNISRAPSQPWRSYGREVWNEIRSQIHGWTGQIETTQRILTKDALEPEELVREINEYNKTAVQEKRIISIRSYRKNYKNISGAPSSPWISYGREVWEEIRSQIHGWTEQIETTQRILTKDALEPEELVREINEYNKTAVQEKRIISIRSYVKNYKNISRAPSEPWRSYGREVWNEIRSQIHGWTGRIETTLEPEELVKEINEYNKTAVQEKRIISTRSYVKNYKNISRTPSDPWKSYGREVWNEIRSQIHDWTGRIETTQRIVTKDPLEPEELVKEINEYNKTAVKEKRIISKKSYEKNYKNISRAPSNPWRIYGREVWNEIRSQIHGWKGRIGTTSCEEFIQTSIPQN